MRGLTEGRNRRNTKKPTKIVWLKNNSNQPKKRLIKRKTKKQKNYSFILYETSSDGYIVIHFYKATKGL